MGLIDYLGRPGARKQLLSGKVPRWVQNSNRAAYISQVIISAPPWVDLKALRALRARAQWETEMHGEQHVLDHIVPLTHPRVCGLTVPWNLRIIPWQANLSKSNHFNPEQGELFKHDPMDLCTSVLSQTPGYLRAKAKPRAAGSGQAASTKAPTKSTGAAKPTQS